MVRHYIKKRAEPSYSIEDISNAVTDVINKNGTYREAESRYGVPMSVIYQRIKGRKTDLQRKGAGRSPALSKVTEETIANCLVARSRMGYPCDKKELVSLVGEFVKVNNLKTPFSGGIPGDDWYQGFMKRHPNLSLKKPELLQKNRKDARDPEVIYDFFDKLTAVVKQFNLDKEENSCFVFNADESGFNTDPSKLRAIGEKGKSVVRVAGGSGRESISVLACVAADGSALPPLIIFKGAAVQARWTSEGAYPDTLYGATSNGWMEEPAFFNWFEVGFVTHIQKLRTTREKPEQTALLLYDGHASHISVRIIESALKNNIQLIRFPSHLTDMMHPLDKCVFGPVKTAWERKLVDYGKSQMGKGSGRVTKKKFAELLGEVWRKAMVDTNIRSGFSSTGILPVNEKMFPESAFDPIDLKRYRKKKSELKESNNDIQIQDTLGTPSLTNIENINVDNTTQSTCASQSSDLASTSSFHQQTESSNLLSLSETKNPITANSIIEIFSSHLQPTNYLNAPGHTEKKVIPRLKQLKYGEILTSEEVLQKVKEAEEKKKEKTKNPMTKRKSTKSKVEHKPKKKKCMKKTKVSDSEEEVDEKKLVQDYSDDELLEFIENDTQEVNYETPQWSEIKPERFLLVGFLGGGRNKTAYKYVCRVQSVDDDDGEIIVQALKSISGRTQFVLLENDISSIQFDMVKAMLPNPETRLEKRKVIYEFPGSVDTFEKH